MAVVEVARNAAAVGVEVATILVPSKAKSWCEPREVALVPPCATASVPEMFPREIQVPPIAKHPEARFSPPPVASSEEVAVLKFAMEPMENRDPGDVDAMPTQPVFLLMVKMGLEVPKETSADASGVVEPTENVPANEVVAVVEVARNAAAVGVELPASVPEESRVKIIFLLPPASVSAPADEKLEVAVAPKYALLKTEN